MQKNSLLAPYSTFGIGGPATYLTKVANLDEMREALAFSCREKIPFFVVGKGSNVLFDDKGFDGLVIINKIAFCNREENRVIVGSGYSFSLLGIQTAKWGLTGLEFASGIPATVGGAIFMNAGANGKETGDSLINVQYMYEDGSVEAFSKDRLIFSYRTSLFQKMVGAIVTAELSLQPDTSARQRQLTLLKHRVQTQPLKEKSAGCIFRNPPSYSAGTLIEASGLKGFRIGGAKVSEVHANFIINEGGASAEDVLTLIQHIQQRVQQQKGISLQMEVRYVSSYA